LNKQRKTTKYLIQEKEPPADIRTGTSDYKSVFEPLEVSAYFMYQKQR